MKNGKLKIGLISMPQTLTAMPSIGLTQLSGIIKGKFPESVSVNIIYGNLDFVNFVGFNEYKNIEANGLVEWMFRKDAFPEEQDNITEIKDYFFAVGKTPAKEKLFDFILNKRNIVKDFLDQLINAYDFTSYDIIGFTSIMSQNIASFALARKIKSLNPSCLMIIGGPNCDYPMGKIIIDKIKYIDYVFSGPGIISFSKFVECILNNDIDGTDKIDGVFSKKNSINSNTSENDQSKSDNNYLINSIGDFHDINMGIELDYEEFLNKYSEFQKKNEIHYKPILFFETARGCWKRDKWPCQFCGLNNPRAQYNCMRPEIAIKYINNFTAKYANESSKLSCVDNIISKQYIQSVLPYLDVYPDTSLMYETRATLSYEEMETCFNSGIRMLQPGIESLNTKTLDLIKKGVSAFGNIKFLKHCIEIGILPIWNMLYGFPNETSEEGFKKLLNDISIFKHLPPPASYIPMGFVRFSPYFDNAEKYGLELKIDPYLRLIYPFKDEELWNLSYFFIDSKKDAPYKKAYNFYTKMITVEVLEWMDGFRNYKDFPKLYFIDRNTILDSRFNIENPVKYTISDLEYEILKYLENPHRKESLVQKFKKYEPEKITKSFHNLKMKNLFFTENDQYMSLVCLKFSLSKEKYTEFINFIALSTASSFQ